MILARCKGTDGIPCRPLAPPFCSLIMPSFSRTQADAYVRASCRLKQPLEMKCRYQCTILSLSQIRRGGVDLPEQESSETGKG